MLLLEALRENLSAVSLPFQLLATASVGLEQVLPLWNPAGNTS